jgi:hypothetical protein
MILNIKIGKSKINSELGAHYGKILDEVANFCLSEKQKS